MLSLYKCPHCNEYGEVTQTNPNTIHNTFKYYACTCNGTVQINPYNIVTIDSDMIKQGMFSKTWTLINPDMMTFNPDKIQLVSIEDFKNDNPMGVTNFLANIEEYYAVGDEYMIADILYKFDHIEYEDDIAEIREAFDLWVIMYDGMYLGIIGVENFIGDPSQDIKWLSWTLSLKEFRSKGIGGKALELLTNTLKKAGIVRLYVDSDLAPGTIRFYEKAGFTKLGTCKKFRKENPLYTKDFLLYDQDIVMYKDLV